MLPTSPFALALLAAAREAAPGLGPWSVRDRAYEMYKPCEAVLECPAGVLRCVLSNKMSGSFLRIEGPVPEELEGLSEELCSIFYRCSAADAQDRWMQKHKIGWHAPEEEP